MLDQLPFEAIENTPERLTTETSFLNETLYKHCLPGPRWEGRRDSDGDLVKRKFGKNLAQSIYEHTHTLFPRVSYLPKSNTLAEQLANDSEGRTAYALLESFMGANFIKPSTAELYLSEKDEESELETAENNDWKAVAEENQKLKQEIKTLRASLHTEMQQRIKADNARQETETEAESMRKELVDLREMVFQYENDIPEPESEDESIAWPCHTAKRIVSYGGHATWLKAIRPLLPDVQFVAPDSMLHSDLIRNADEVWLQVNCMSHKDFYRVIDIVRTHGKTLRYFQYASAKKCAEQLVFARNEGTK